ncbi:DUF7937 domain-containing protein [Cellulomonas alba]|uniref:DUF4173 domain-containing protein n=1 Tax=Cellulomonas alba TaxID=3053467 RepID=A0ABT7SI61_9CELL|nr:hypothetical protein [Cellulomonas alba]MDM7855881.1 hypothetical protein [Cellulomonas alba]
MSTPHDVPVTPAPGAAWRRPNPFGDVPARDYATDAVALVLLCVSLGLAWSFHDRAWQRVDVVLVSAVSVASLAVTYVVRARGGSLRTALRVRAWLGLPYAVCVLASAAVDAVGAFALRITGPTLPGGLGPAVAVGLAGAALAAAPRAAESADAALAGAARRLARSILGGLLAGVVVLQALTLGALASGIVRFLDRVGAQTWVGLTADAVLVLLVTALAGGPLLATLRGSAPWRWVLVAIAATTTALTLTDGFPVATMLPDGSGGPGLVLVPAAGAVALGAAVSATLRRVEPPVRAWCEVARAAWVAIAVAAGALVVIHLLGLIHLLHTVQQLGGDLHPGRVTGRIALVVALDAVIVVLALAASVVVGRRGLDARPVGLWLTAAAVVVGTAIIATRGWARPGLTDTIVAYGLPILAVLALTVPDAVRESARLPRGSATYGPGVGADGPATGAHDGAGAADHGFTTAQAADPATDLAVLAAIVERAPELRPLVAANPSAYPDLLAWLAQLHDPDVDAALASRPS